MQQAQAVLELKRMLDKARHNSATSRGVSCALRVITGGNGIVHIYNCQPQGPSPPKRLSRNVLAFRSCLYSTSSVLALCRSAQSP